MRVGHGIDHLQHGAAGGVGRKHPAVDFPVQGVALEVLEDEVPQAVKATRFVQRNDVRMTQLGQIARLRRVVFFPGPTRRTAHHLDRHQPVQPRVMRQIDRPLTATAERLDDLETADSG